MPPLSGVNTPILAGSQDFFESQENSSYLWTRDTFALCNLLEKGGLYHQPGTVEALEVLNPGDEHIIIQEINANECWVKESDEYYIRGTAYTLRAKGVPFSQIKVLGIDGSLLSYTEDDEKLNEIGLMLLPVESIIAPRPFTDWEDDLVYRSYGLSLREAAEIAELIVAKLEPCDPLQATIALDLLRRRAGMSEYTWDKKYLKNIRAKLERCLAKTEEGQKAENSFVKQFKADLQAIAETDDSIIQLLKINKLASTYRIPAREIRKALSQIEAETRNSKAKFFNADDFLSMEVEGIDYLIPGLLPRGESALCVALPKVGKTLLSIDAAFAVATGEADFLGEKVQQGKVLLISVDESPQSTRFKLLKRGFRASDADNLKIMTDWDVSQMGILEETLDNYRPDLVIIDSLKRITVGREVSENSAEFADIIYRLKELTGRYGAASILIHHANKNSEATGVAKVRGNTAIVGSVWGIWQLEQMLKTKDKNGKTLKKPKFDPSDPRRIFTATCRDTDSRNFLIEFNPENHSYTVANEEAEGERERKTQEQLILELLAQHSPNGLTGREIMNRLGLGRSVYSTLNRMVSRRTVTHRQSTTDRRMMVYTLPQSKFTPPELDDKQVLTKSSESIDIKGENDSQQIVSTPNETNQSDLAPPPENPPNNSDADNLKPMPDKAETKDSQQVAELKGRVSDTKESETQANTQLAQEEITSGAELAQSNNDCEDMEEVAQTSISRIEPVTLKSEMHDGGQQFSVFERDSFREVDSD